MKKYCSLYLFLSVIPYIRLSSGFEFHPSEELLLTGTFSGISFLKNDAAEESTLKNKRNSIIVGYNNKTLYNLGELSEGGQVHSLCSLKYNDSIILFAGGNFSSINNKHVNNIAFYDFLSETWDYLKGGVDGPVLSLFCDSDIQQVYLGGLFKKTLASEKKLPSGSFHSTGGILNWDHSNSSWNPLFFQGVNGGVKSIISKPNKNVLIAGSFNATLDEARFLNPFLNLVDPSLYALNEETLSLASQKSPDSCRIDDRMTKIQNANYIDILHSKNIMPSGIRLWNTVELHKSSKKFFLTTLPDNLPLKSKGLTNSGISPCKEYCTLKNMEDSQYFSFEFIERNSSGIRIHFLDNVGSGLKNLELYSYNHFVSIQEMMVPFCRIAEPDKYQDITANHSLKATADSSSIVLVSEVFASGYYKVYLELQPCTQSSCSNRSPLDISISSIYSESNAVEQDISLEIFSFDLHSHLIYEGYLSSIELLERHDLSLTSFTIKPKFKSFNFNKLISGLNFVKIPSRKNLPGVMEFSFDKNHTASMIVESFTPPQVPFEVETILAFKDSLFVAGNSNKNAIVQEWGTDPPRELINTSENNFSEGIVNFLSLKDNFLIAGGSFNITSKNSKDISSSSVSNLAKLDLNDQSHWTSLQHNLSAPYISSMSVDNQDVDLSDPLISGIFKYNFDKKSGPISSTYLKFNSHNDISESLAFLNGNISAISSFSSWTIFAGRFKGAEEIRTSNLGLFSTNGSFISFPELPNTNNPSSNSTFNIGLIYNPPNSIKSKPEDLTKRNTTVIVAGKMTQNSTTGLGVYQNNQWETFMVFDSGNIYSLLCADSDLFIGGDFTGPFDSEGLITWSFNSQTFSALPTPFSKTNKRARVNIMKRIPDSTKIVVGGDFDGPGGKSNCRHICLLEVDLLEWYPLKKEIPSYVTEVLDVTYFNNSIVVATKQNEVQNHLLFYDTESNNWSESNFELPGTATFVNFDNSTQGVFISGLRKTNSGDFGSFLTWWNGSKLYSLDDSIQKSLHIQQITLIHNSTSNGTAANTQYGLTIPKFSTLLVSGNLYLDSYGNCSSALFNGSHWRPYFTTSYLKNDVVQPGFVSVFQKTPYFPHQKEYLSTPIIILISLGISITLLFLVISIGVSLNFLMNRNNINSPEASVPLLVDSLPSESPTITMISSLES